MQKTCHNGVLITFEGGEGGGKTTLIGKLKEALEKQGKKVLVTREPGGTSIGEAIRDILLQSKDPLSPKAELLLFLAARAEHIASVISPALKQGMVVLCDRFNDSSIAYQGYARGLGFDYVESLVQVVSGEITPYKTFFLDIDPQVGLKRATELHADRLENESLSFHQKVREGFHLLAKKYPNRIAIIDASLSVEAVFQQVFALL